ncbi:transposase [Bradyrhizobium sp. LB8.2]
MHRVPQKDKLLAVEAVKSGLTPHHVGKRMCVYHSTVAKWFKEFEKTGQVAPAGKLDPYAERISAMIAEDPSRSTNSLHTEFIKREQVKVAYTRFSKFISELGFVRDSTTKLMERESSHSTAADRAATKSRSTGTDL